MKCHECQAELPADARFCLSCGARVLAAPPSAPVDPLRDALEKAIGFQYRIERLLGRGGMGAVYLGHELALDRDVAIKVLPTEHASTLEMRERFKREARTAARLTHSNIVPLHTFGEVSGLMYFVMGYVDGESLADRIKRQGAFEAEAARTILVGVCDALEYAHQRGVVHRDIKPDNILIEAESGMPLLTDFGIAKSGLADAQLTTAGQLIGTPHYMSPEQATGSADVGPSSDLYSLGIVAYEMLSGQRPFEAATPLEVVTRRLTHAPAPLTSIAGTLPSDLEQAITRCLQKKPADRWPDAKSLKHALQPSDDEAEETPVLRMLRGFATVAFPALLVAFAYVQVLRFLHRDSAVLRRMTGLGLGMLMGLFMVITVFTVRLKRDGLSLMTIVRKVYEQPRWWRAWYPRRLRRPGDVWDRLPREFRQSRGFRGVFLAFFGTVFLPLYLIAIWERLTIVTLSLLVIMLAGASTMVYLRRRAVKMISARAQVQAAQALTILTTPSWRVSAWRGPATSQILAGAASATSATARTSVLAAQTSHAPTAPAVTSAAATAFRDTSRDDEVTRL